MQEFHVEDDETKCTFSFDKSFLTEILYVRVSITKPAPWGTTGASFSRSVIDGEINWIAWDMLQMTASIQSYIAKVAKNLVFS